MFLRSVNHCDLLDIFEWRNDPMICSMFQNPSTVSFDESLKWFDESLNNPNRVMYVG
jgi:hypothetical protein